MAAMEVRGTVRSSSSAAIQDDPRGRKRVMRAAGDLALAVSRHNEQQHQQQQQQCSTGHHYCYTDAVTRAVVQATRGGACQAMTRLRYFLQGDKSAIVAVGDGFRFRPQFRTAKDAGMVSECVPCEWGHTANPPLGLSPKSFQSMCRCAVCGTVRLLRPRAHRKGAAGDIRAAAWRQQGDDVSP